MLKRTIDITKSVAEVIYNVFLLQTICSDRLPNSRSIESIPVVLKIKATPIVLKIKKNALLATF